MAERVGLVLDSLGWPIGTLYATLRYHNATENSIYLNYNI